MSFIIEKINKFYGKQQALTNVSFSLKKGEVVGFLGANGAGKSTTLKVMTGYLMATSGYVYVNNLNIKSDFFPFVGNPDSKHICFNSETFLFFNKRAAITLSVHG